MKRNDYILERLLSLNVRSIQEGLLQLLNYAKTEIREHRSLMMVYFLPNLEDSVTIENSERIANKEQSNQTIAQSVSLLTRAVEFTKDHPVDSGCSKVFVNNIGFKVKQSELWSFFEHFGKVLHVYIAKDRKTRRSKGFGFVVFSSPFDAQRAIKAKKYDLKLNGRVMQVSLAVKKKKNRRTTDGNPGKVNQKIKDAVDYFLEENIEEEASELTEKDLMKEEEQEHCLINDILCDDMLMEVFKYMDMRCRVQLELVCKRWYNVAVKSWCQISHLHFKNVFNLSHKQASLTDRILISILNKNCSNLKTVDLSHSPFLITYDSLKKVASTCQNLEELNLSYVLLKLDSAKVLGKNLTNLKKLTLSNCMHMGEKAYWWLFKNQKELKELRITDTRRLIGNCIYMLPSSLTVVDFENCSEFNDTGLKYLAARCPNLLHLNLSFCIRITDNSLGNLFEKCTKIEELLLKGLGHNVTNVGLECVTNLKNLIELDISRNECVTDEVLRNIALTCKKLSKLNIEACHGNISTQGINDLCFCQNLIELNISYIVHVTNECVSELAMEGKLQKLFIRSSPEITDQAAVTCIQYLDHLQVLDLSGCFYITNELPKLLQSIDIDKSHAQMEIILGGTELTEDGYRLFEGNFDFLTVRMQNLQIGMLRNDRDPTLVRAFFPDSSDEDEDEEEIKPELIVLKPEYELDLQEDYPICDEDGESMWVTFDPDHEKLSRCNLSAITNHFNSHVPLPAVMTPQDASSVDVVADEEENWDDDLVEGCLWSAPIESLETFGKLDLDYDDFLENDDVSRSELIG